MIQDYKTVASAANDEFTEKRSRFIGYCTPVSCEQDAIDFINQIRSRHWVRRSTMFSTPLKRVQRTAEQR